MRSVNLKKCLVAGVFSIILLSILPVVSSESAIGYSEYEVVEEYNYYQSMLSPLPTITKPQAGCWYLNDDLLFTGMPTTRIIGYITVTVKVFDPTGDGVNRVEFKIDDDLKGVDNTPTIDDEGYYWFEWLCDDELPGGEHELKVVAFDNLGNSQSRTIMVTKGLFNFTVYEYNAYLEACKTQGLEAAVGSTEEMSSYYENLVSEENQAYN